MKSRSESKFYLLRMSAVNVETISLKIHLFIIYTKLQSTVAFEKCKIIYKIFIKWQQAYYTLSDKKEPNMITVPEFINLLLSILEGCKVFLNFHYTEYANLFFPRFYTCKHLPYTHIYVKSFHSSCYIFTYSFFYFSCHCPLFHDSYHSSWSIFFLVCQKVSYSPPPPKYILLGHFPYKAHI